MFDTARSAQSYKSIQDSQLSHHQHDITFLVGESQPKPSLPNVAAQKSSRHKGPPQRWCYPNPGPPRTWRAARSALCCWKAWCHQEFARRSKAALKDRILQSSILLNFITPHIHTHIKAAGIWEGVASTKKLKKTPTKQSSKAKDSLELPNHPHPEGAPNMAQNTHAHKRETWTKSSSSTYKECQVYAQICTSSSILSTSASGSYWSQSL